MKAKLIKKDEDNYVLLLNNPKECNYSLPPLSIKNCQAIERGYDLDELFESVPRNLTDENDKWKLRAGFITGFQKALEILGDKKFSENELKLAFFHVQNEPTFDVFKESLQQTEWDVEIVEVEDGEVYSVSENMKVAHDKTFDGVLFKYDADGCLILRRI